MLRKGAATFTRDFISFDKPRSIGAFLLVLSTAIMESAGLLLILPVLELYGGDDGAGTGLGALARDALEQINLVTPQAQLLAGLAFFICVWLLRSGLMSLRDVTLRKLTIDFVDHWRLGVFTYLTQSPWSHLSTLRHANIEHSLNTDIERLGGGTAQILRGFSAFILLISQIAATLILSWQLTMIVVASLSFAVLALRPLIRSAGYLGQSFTRRGRDVHALLAQFLSGLKLAKVYKAESQYVDMFSETVKALRHERLRFAVEQAQANMFFKTFIGLLMCVIIYIGLFVLRLDIAVLTVFVFILVRLSAPFSILQQGLQALNNMLPAYEAIVHITRQAHKKGAYSPVNAIEYTPHEDAGSDVPVLEMQNVSFRYPDADEDCLRDITLKLFPGEKIVLRGDSGGGKTTLIDIILGLHHPSHGQVHMALRGKFNGAKSQISYVPQDPFIFDATLRENLTWMNGAISDEDIWNALSAVGAEGFVRTHNSGLDFRIGERGVAISGGERQRLCLARALLTRPQLLILDEATNALDLDLEANILRRLCRENPEISLIIISHRPTCFDFIDRVFTLKNGRISEGATA